MPDDSLGFAVSRLQRHSAELGEADVPPADAEDARRVLLSDGAVLVRDGSALHDAGAAIEDPATRIFLGRVDGAPVFAGSVAPEAVPADLQSLDLRTLAVEGAVPAHQLGLLATARSMLLWHARHGFCANCGTRTVMAAAGFRRECPSCGAHHFPRTDPVVIMLLRRGETCLLGRAPRFPEGMFSCLAGFLEPGETIEDAVRRETFEETRVRVGAVAYHASQPWPFPSALMIGCVGQALDETITADPAELAEARWFDRAEVAAMLERRHPAALSAPPAMAIAHHLMRAFVDGRA